MVRKVRDVINPYALLDVFTPDEAVQAITGIVLPSTPDEKNQVALFRKVLEDAIDSGKLKATVTTGHGVYQERVGMRRIGINDTRDHRPIVEHPYTTRDIRIARDDLLAWCESRNIRSPLLFPDLPTEKPLHDLERQTLLAIIRALAALQGIQSDSGAYRKEAESLLAALAGKGITGPCNDKTLAKHLKEAFSAR